MAGEENPEKAADLNRRAEEFAKEYKALIERHYGQLEPDDFEPFAMQVRRYLPVTEMGVGDRVTTTRTVSIPWDIDPPDQDVALSV